jgi:hypothetical protein
VRENDQLRRPIRRFLAGGAVLLSVSLAAVPAAIALKVSKRPATIASTAFGAATAQCPKGRTAVAGGFAAPGFNPDAGPSIGRLGSTHAGNGSIRARGYNFGDIPGDLVSYAYCALHDHGFRIRSASTEIEPQTMGSASTECPAGTKVVGGGFDASPVPRDNGPGVLTLTSKRHGLRSWKTVAVNIPPDSGTGIPGTLTAFAYCENAPFALTTESKEIRPPAGRLDTVDLRCAHGGRAFSGGFDGHLSLGSQPSATAAVTSRRVSNGHAWRTSAISIFDSGPGTATVYAYCRE